MPKAKLTDLTIRNLQAPAFGQETYWDENLPGFGCRVSQGGQKTFVVMYGPREIRRRKIVGRYPHQSLKEARDQAKRIQAEIALGIISEPKKASQSVTFDEAVDRFLNAARQRSRPRTVSDYDRLLSRHFAFGRKRVADIDKQDLQKCLAKLDRVPSERKHADTVIRIFFNWAYREELVDENPVARLQRLANVAARERVLSARDLGEVFAKAKCFPWPFGPIVCLCILTGQRRSEIGGLKWDWIDLGERLISFPGEHVKNGRTHTFPIGPATAQMIAELPRIDGFVFSGRNQKNETFNGWSKSKREFDKTLIGVERYTLHDLRRTFSTMHAKIGTPIHITERLLNHASGSISGVAAIYNRHTYFAEMRKAVMAYEMHLAQMPMSTD
ncbi:site-specific integrase [Hoeflea sp. AS60]|uniref:tyrosine-type recombinase/integrase n=1 Tax=Hoeflea sp. AS60 TaxID=3135780 RepID=UPI00316D3A54